MLLFKFWIRKLVSSLRKLGPVRKTKKNHFFFLSLRVIFKVKPDSGYAKDAGVNTFWKTLQIPFDIKTIGQLTSMRPRPLQGT